LSSPDGAVVRSSLRMVRYLLFLYVVLVNPIINLTLVSLLPLVVEMHPKVGRDV